MFWLWVHQPFDVRWNVFYCIISPSSAFINCSLATRSSWHCSGSEGMSPTQGIANTTAQLASAETEELYQNPCLVISYRLSLAFYLWCTLYPGFEAALLSIYQMCTCADSATGHPSVNSFFFFFARETSLKNIFLENEISLENQWPNISEVSCRRGEWFKDQSVHDSGLSGESVALQGSWHFKSKISWSRL